MASRSAAVLITGTASTAKLFVAALAFTAAYAGLSAYDTANSAPKSAQTVTLSARELPIISPAHPAATVPAPEPGRIAVSSLPTGAGCAKTYVARSALVNPAPDQTLLYGWRLARWSHDSNTWDTYLTGHSGFYGAEQVVDWDADITANPGWYRIELTPKGGGTVRSERFQVSC